MSDNCLKIFGNDGHMKILFDHEFLEIFGIDSNRCVHRLLENLCGRSQLEYRISYKELWI
jgi:hypothetical protein